MGVVRGFMSPYRFSGYVSCHKLTTEIISYNSKVCAAGS